MLTPATVRCAALAVISLLTLAIPAPASSPSTGFNKVSGNILLQHLFHTETQVVETFHPNHGIGTTRPVSTILTRLSCFRIILINQICQASLQQIKVQITFKSGDPCPKL